MGASRKIEVGFFLLLSVGTAVLVFFIFKPYLSALFLALVCALVCAPVHGYILARLRSRNLAALTTLFLLLLLVLAPSFFIGYSISDDAQRLYISFREGTPIAETVGAWPLPFESELERAMPNVRERLSLYLSEGLAFLVSRFGVVFSEVLSFIFKTVIMLLALFYLLREGKSLHAFVVRLSPLTNAYDERILLRLKEAVVSVVQGRLLIISIQGLLGGFGFFLFGIPHPVLLGVFTALSALVPAVGVALVFVPIMVYFLSIGAIGSTMGLLVISCVVGLIDNVLSPFLFERGLRIHPFLILLSILGGLAFFGPVGFLAGPVALSLFFALLDVYPLLFERGSSSS